MKKASLFLRIAATALLVAAIVCLLIPGRTTYKSETLEVNPETQESKVISSNTNEGDIVNYFSRWKVLGEAGLSDGLEGFILILFVASLAVVVSSFIVDPTKKIYFAAVSLALCVLCIMFLAETDAWHLLHNRITPTEYGYELHRQNSVMFGFNILPTLVCAIAAFLSQLASGVCELLMDIKAKKLEDAE